MPPKAKNVHSSPVISDVRNPISSLIRRTVSEKYVFGFATSTTVSLSI